MSRATLAVLLLGSLVPSGRVLAAQAASVTKLFDVFGDDLYLAKARLTPVDALVAALRLEGEEGKRHRCQQFTKMLPDLRNRLQVMPPRSPLVSANLVRSLTLVSHACAYSAEQLHKELSLLFGFDRAVLDLALSPTSLAFYVPLHADGQGPLMKWLWPAAIASATQQQCATSPPTHGLPAKAACFAPWLFQQLGGHDLKPAASPSEARELLDELLRAVPKDQVITYWSPLLAEAVHRSGIPNRALVERLLLHRPAMDAAALILDSARGLSAVIADDATVGETLRRKDCEAARAVVLEVPEVLSKRVVASKPKVDQLSGAVAGRLLVATCGDRSPSVRADTAQFWANWPIGAPIETRVSAIKNPSLLDLAVHSFDDDLAERNALGLKFNYGAPFDHEELMALEKASDVQTAATDHIIAAFLRGVDSSPWVRQVENIEDLNLRAKLTERVLVGLAKSGQPGFRLLQMKYLDSFDFQEESGKSSQDLMNAIRQNATNLGAQLPAMRPFAFEIHNSLHIGLADGIAELREGLAKSDRETHGAALERLIADVRTFFRLSDAPATALQGSLNKIESRDTKLATGVRQVLEKAGASSDSRDRVKALARVQEGILGALVKRERALPKDVWRQRAIAAGDYVELLRMLRAVNGLMISHVSQLDRDQDALWPVYAKYVSRFVGMPEASATPKVADLVDQIATTLRDNLAGRTLRFQWLMESQARRRVDSPDYKLSVAYRRYALEALHEKMIRDAGLHLLARFDTSESIGSGWRPMNKGIASGRLTFVPRSSLDGHSYRRDEVLITDGLPLNLGVTAALITEVFQPLASHVDLRTKERGTPNAFVADARQKWAGLFGKWVEVEVAADGVKMTEIAPEAARREGSHAAVTVDLPDTSISPDVVDLDGPEERTTIARVGAKAFAFAHLRRIFGPKSHTPRALAVPFDAYEWVVEEFGIRASINELLSRTSEDLSPEEFEARLKAIREAFKAAAASAKFKQSDWYQRFSDQLAKLYEETKAEGDVLEWGRVSDGCFRFRSSTNAEDLVGFTGAGLYDSKTGCISGSDGVEGKEVAAALGKVWGSLWTNRAFMEREHAGIPHSRVAMAVLIHRNYPSEDANGVALTRSRLDPLHRISVQPLEESVTNSVGGQSGDEVTARLVSEKGKTGVAIEAARYKDPTKPLLSERELIELMTAGERILTVMRRKLSHVPNAPLMRMDLEFKFLRDPKEVDRRLVIKQARPFLSD